MGEPTKLVVLEKVVEIIKRDKLVNHTKEVGEYLQKRLKELETNHPKVFLVFGSSLFFNFLVIFKI